MNRLGTALLAATLICGGAATMRPDLAYAETKADLDSASTLALRKLEQSDPFATRLAHEARAILIFPNVVKAGLVFGGSYGEGELQSHGMVQGYYNTVSASWGLQAGAQSYGYVLFLMSDKALSYVRSTHGWELGVGPTVVVVDKGAAANLSTTTLHDDAYAFVFGQQGLMAGVSIEGTKISRIKQ